MLILLKQSVNISVKLVVRFVVLDGVHHRLAVRRVRQLALVQKPLKDIDLLHVLRQFCRVLVDLREIVAVLHQDS